MSKPVEEFLDLVRRSKLVDNDRLELALAELEKPLGDSGIVGTSLIKAGLLTQWQSEKLRAGRYKGFFLGKYKILNHLGTGGMSSVYLAEHVVMRHRVAIKVLPQNLLRQSSYLERFHQEARAAARLDHPNMVRAFDVDHENDTYYLVMEYVEGFDIKTLVERDGPLPFRTAADYVRQAAEGLAYAHQKGLIHRDVKPANLLVDHNGTIKILDLGLARFVDDQETSLTRAHDEKMIGTVDYLAPEQALDSHAVDARADIYSLGCTLYFMLTGHPPFPEGTIPQRMMKHQKEEPASIHRDRPDVPEELVTLCSRMMAKLPERRVQSMSDVANAMLSWLTGGEVSSSGSGRIPFVPPPPSTTQSIANDEDLELAPLDDEPAKSGASTRPTTAKPTAKKPPAAPATEPAKPDKPAAAAAKSDSAIKRLPQAKAVQPAAPAQVDDLLDELMTNSGHGLESGGGDWNSGSPLFPVTQTQSVWYVIGIGGMLGVMILIIVFAIWFFTR